MNRAAVLRRAVPDDAVAVAEIHMAARAAAMPWLAVIHSPEDVRRYFAHDVLAGAEVWTANVGGEVAGFVACRRDWVEHLYVAPGFTRRGLGESLLATAKRGASQLQLWTFQRNTDARRFYEREGFALAELTDGSGNEEREPDARYVWQGQASPDRR